MVKAKYHHTATRSGYICIADNYSKIPYVGKFGKGYKVLIRHPHSSRYHFEEYYIEECSTETN